MVVLLLDVVESEPFSSGRVRYVCIRFRIERRILLRFVYILGIFAISIIRDSVFVSDFYTRFSIVRKE